MSPQWNPDWERTSLAALNLCRSLRKKQMGNGGEGTKQRWTDTFFFLFFSFSCSTTRLCQKMLQKEGITLLPARREENSPLPSPNYNCKTHKNNKEQTFKLVQHRCSLGDESGYTPLGVSPAEAAIWMLMWRFFLPRQFKIRASSIDRCAGTTAPLRENVTAAAVAGLALSQDQIGSAWHNN